MQTKPISFKTTATEGNARTGIIETKSGSFETPAFTPVATAASVRSLISEDLLEMGAQVTLANTYHLHLNPGEKTVKKLGGVAKFMNWQGPTFTDSGGFQAFSLGYGMEHGIGKIAENYFTGEQRHVKKEKKLATITDKGVTFRDHIQGSKIFFNPKISMKIQSDIGADIIFAFDECTSPLSSKEYTARALERTHVWAKESIKYHDKKQALFGIVQGGAYKDLRIQSAKFIGDLPFDGFGIGGSLGTTKKDMHDILEWTVPILPENKPRHLLGIGAVEDIFESVERGIDTFDCVAPTRWGRRGHLYISPKAKGTKKNKFRINIKQAKYKQDKKPIDLTCECMVCKNYTRAYLRHLFIAKEISFHRLAAYHNVYFILNLMKTIREAIKKQQFKKVKKEWLK